jgi:hypothetical protein
VAKIKIEIDLDDIFTDDGESIKEHIINEIHNDVWRRIKDNIGAAITTEIERDVMRQARQRIGSYIDDFVKNGVLNPGTSKEIKIDDFLRDKISSHDAWMRKL